MGEHLNTPARNWRELLVRQKMAQKGGGPSMKQCMHEGCKAPPEVECIWADGRGRAWHCQKHHDAWVEKGKTEDGLSLDIVKQRKVPNGEVGKKYGEYPETAKKALLSPQNLVAMYRQADTKDGKTTGYRESVGLFIRLPEDLAEQFPSLAPQDNSPPHVTLLFIGHLPEGQDELFLSTVHKVFAEGLPTIKARLAGVDHFIHPEKDRAVAHCPVNFNRGLSEIRTKLRSALEDVGIEVGDSFPIYRPHVTLGYLPDTASRWKGPVPQGTWEFDKVEVWGLPKEHHISFGTPRTASVEAADKKGKTATIRIAAKRVLPRGEVEKAAKEFIQILAPRLGSETWTSSADLIPMKTNQDFWSVTVTIAQREGKEPDEHFGTVREAFNSVPYLRENFSYDGWGYGGSELTYHYYSNKVAFVAEDGWDASGTHRVVLWPETSSEEGILQSVVRSAFEQAGYQTTSLQREGASGLEVLSDRLTPTGLVTAHLIRKAGYYSVGDMVLYGKYKNKRGRVVGTGRDDKGNPTIEVEPVPKGKKKNKTLSVLKVWHEEQDKRAEIQDDEPTELEELLQNEMGEDLVTSIVAKYKDKHEDKDGNVHYEYSPKQVQHRNREKAKRIEGLKSAMPKLQEKVRKDLKSKDPKTKLTALAVALMDETYERVGNDTSAGDGHFGVTGWQAGHVSFKGRGATIKYTGKSGVDHEKKVTTPALISALKEAVGGKDKTHKILSFECEEGDSCVSPSMVNDYLNEFGITAKDIRGYHANDEMLTRLKAVRGKGQSLPHARKEKDEILKAEFEQALEETAEAVGHEPATLKSNYLVPGVHDSYMHDGTVMESFFEKTSTKDPHEKEEDSAEGLVKKEPKKKPPRNDLRRRRVNDHEDDPDLKPPNATNDPDLSHNYKGRNARGKKLKALPSSGTFMGGTFYGMNVRDDRFVHFTPSSRAVEILQSKKLLMNPPYEKFGVDAVAAVSLVYGSSVPGVQTTHIKSNEELVGVIFSTNAIPDIGYVEEVLWSRDVPIFKVRIVPARQAFSMLSKTPERIGENDQVFYEGSSKYRQMDLGTRAAALSFRFIQSAKKKKKKKKEWWQGKKFPHKTEDGKTTQVGWKSLTPEEQAKFQKEQDSKKDEGGKKTKKKKKEDPGDPSITLGALAQDPSASNILWQAAAGDKDGKIPTASDLADLHEHVKGTRITEEVAQEILDMHESGISATNLKGAIEAKEKKVIGDILAKAGVKSSDLEKRLKDMSPEDKAKLTEAMEKTEAEYLETPVSSDVAAKLAKDYDGDFSDKDLSGKPEELGKRLAERAFTQNVVLNPLMAGGRAVNDEEKTPEELQARGAAAFDTFRDLEPEARNKAVDKIHERLKEIEKETPEPEDGKEVPESPEAKELNAILDGLALTAALRGEAVEGRAPPSSLFTEVAKGLEKQGETHQLLKATDPNSTAGRDALRNGMENMSDEAMISTIKGTSVLDLLGERLANAQTPEGKAGMRQIMIDIATDDIQFVDPMIRDGLEAKGDKEKSEDPKVRDNIRKEIHNKAFGAMAIPENLDDSTRKYLRMNLLQWALGRVKKMMGSGKSMAVTQVESAIEADEPDLLNVPAAKPVSRPVEKAQKAKKGAQSGAYTPKYLSEGPFPSGNRGMNHPELPCRIRRNKMSKLLTKKGAEQILDHANRLAQVIQDNWEALGIPTEKHAKDLAYRIDVFSDTVEKKASDDAVRLASMSRQAETVGEGTIKNDEGAKLRGGTPAQDNMTKEVQGPNDFDEANIGKIKPPEQTDADEPYMDAFTQDEFHQLADLQQSGDFSNAKAAAATACAQAAQAIAQAVAAL